MKARHLTKTSSLNSLWFRDFSSLLFSVFFSFLHDFPSFSNVSTILGMLSSWAIDICLYHTLAPMFLSLPVGIFFAENRRKTGKPSLGKRKGNGLKNEDVCGSGGHEGRDGSCDGENLFRQGMCLRVWSGGER